MGFVIQLDCLMHNKYTHSVGIIRLVQIYIPLISRLFPLLPLVRRVNACRSIMYMM